MYAVDELDRVLERFDLPQACTGMPRAVALSDESNVSVAYATQKGWNDPARTVPQYAIITFIDYSSYMFGQPGEKVFAGHPLYARGLEPYSFSEVIGSSWIRQMARVDATNPYHADSCFEDCRHFILAFKNSMFECISRGYSHVLFEGTEEGLLARMGERHALLRAGDGL
jgi:hypothetical protein